MVIFVDTSALIALLNSEDQFHAAASQAWLTWINESHQFYTSNYVVLESYALIQQRLGLAAVKGLQTNLIPLCNIHWVSPKLHAVSVSSLFAANRRQLSLVDCTSFAVMRQLGLNTAFAFDPHFAEQGFTVLPDSQ